MEQEAGKEGRLRLMGARDRRAARPTKIPSCPPGFLLIPSEGLLTLKQRRLRDGHGGGANGVSYVIEAKTRNRRVWPMPDTTGQETQS